MTSQTNIGRLIELNGLAREEGRKYPKRRDLFAKLADEGGRHFTGIVGPRGAGKTVLLRQLAADHADAFYVSADALDPDTDFFSLVRRLVEQLKIRTVLLDEIHFLTSPAAVLKQVYDFLEVRVVFTSSVALAMHTSAHDLSRRVHLLTLHDFSFREYLRFVADLDLPPIGIATLADRRWQPEHLHAGHRFDDYLKGGLLPFSLSEPDPLPLLSNIQDKVIQRDIPSVLRLAVDELDILKRLLQFVGRSAVDGINYSSLARNLGITKYKAEQYASCLEKAFILRQVFPAGTSVLREPKILMAPPYRLLYRDYEDAIGGLREDFCAEALGQADIPFRYLKSTRGEKTPDYLVETGTPGLVIEIGGKGKGRAQFKGVKADRKIILAHTDLPDAARIPLFLLGFLV